MENRSEAVATMEAQNETVRWWIQSDSALRPVDERIAGGRAFQVTRRLYRTTMRPAIETYLLLKRGGLSARNWMRLECVSEIWEEGAARTSQPGGAAVGECRPVDRPPSAVEERHPVDGGDTRRGARDVSKSAAGEASRRMRITQDRYDARMKYFEPTSEIEILTASLIEGRRDIDVAGNAGFCFDRDRTRRLG